MIMDNIFYFGLSWESRFENSISKQQQIEKEEAEKEIPSFLLKLKIKRPSIPRLFGPSKLLLSQIFIEYIEAVLAAENLKK